MRREKPLSEQVVVIGGASYGLGRAIAVGAARRGAKVVVLPIGWGAQKLLSGQKLSPPAGDLVLLRTGWKGQQTEELKPVDSPDNLFAPLPGDPGAHGRFDGRARERTAWTSLRLYRGVIGAGVALATIGLLAGRSGRFSTPKRTLQSWPF